MAQSKNLAFIKPELLAWAREEAGLTPEIAARRAGLTIEKLLACEQGDAQLTLNQLRALSNAYKRPLAFFYLPQPPPRSAALRDFRRLPEAERNATPALRLEIRRARYRRQIALRLYDELREAPPQFAVTTNLEANTHEVAREIRALLGITQQQQYEFSNEYEAYGQFREAVEAQGVLVFQTNGVKLSEMRGFSITDTPLPVVVVNNKDIPRGKIFTMFHELTHIMLRSGGLCNLSEQQDMEVFCNMVAGAALVPQEWLLNEREVRGRGPQADWPEAVIKTLSNRYKASREVIIRRLLIAGYATQDFYLRKREEYRREAEEHTQSGGFSPPPHIKTLNSAGRTFVELVLNSYRQEIITPNDASDYLHIRMKYMGNLEKAVQHPTLELGAA